jgi:hypothetical protein
MDLVLDHHFFYGLLVGLAVTILWGDFQVPQMAEKIEPIHFDWTKLLNDLKSEDYRTRNNARRDINRATESYMSFRLAYNEFLNEEEAQRIHNN